MLKQTNKQTSKLLVLLFNKENTEIPQNLSRNSSSSSYSTTTTTAAVVSVSENNKLPKLLYE
jgi:hypothetical protein